MKRFALLTALLTICALPLIAGGANASEFTMLVQTDVFETQARIDEALLAEMSVGFDFSEPEVILDPYQVSPLTAVILFHTDEVIGGTIAVKGRHERDTLYGTIEPATEHLVPVYGLYSGATTQVELTLDNGRSTTLEISTEAQNLDFGTFDVQMIDESAIEPGWLTFIYPFGGTIYAVDSAGDIRWCYSGGGSMGIHRLANGHLLVPMPYTLKTSYYKEGLQEIDLNGRIYAQYAIPGGQHHDFRELPNGNLLVATDAPDLSSVEDWVVEIDRNTGEVVWSLDMKELLAQKDGQSASMDTDGSEEADWCHNNGLWYDAANDRVLLSCRHLDAIVAVNRSDKSLAWILADPSGWTQVDPGLFFTPEGDGFEWQYAQHQVSMLDNGDIMLFDNGTAKVKRVDAAARVSGDDVYSRAVVYRVNTQDMTIRQVWEYGKARGPEWYSDWVSGVESLDGTQDDLWITAGSHLYSPEENRHDFYPSDMMSPGLIKSTHIDHVRNGALVYELTISGETFLSLAYRSSYMPAYVEGGQLDPAAAPVLLGSLGETPWRETEVVLEGAPMLDNTGWNITLDGTKLMAAGTYHTNKAPEEMGEFSLVLASDTETRAYLLNAFPAQSEADSAVSLSGWVSRELPQGRYHLYVVLDGEAWDTGMEADL